MATSFSGKFAGRKLINGRNDRLMATIKDVAKDSNVSIATVSNVINNTKFVSPEIQKRVYDSMERLGYATNHIAKNLRDRKSTRLNSSH